MSKAHISYREGNYIAITCTGLKPVPYRLVKYGKVLMPTKRVLNFKTELTIIITNALCEAGLSRGVDLEFLGINADNGVKIFYDFCFSHPKTSKDKRMIPKTTTPDLDNLVKTMNDTIQEILGFNDKFITSIEAKKSYFDRDLITIVLCKEKRGVPKDD